MRVGIIGAGLQALRRAPAVKAHPNTELVVISSASAQSAQALAYEHGCEAAQGWESVARRDDLDAIIVCTPPKLHASISIAAMKSGKHVLCEKPLSYTLEEGTEMVRTAQEMGKILKCGFNHRYHPAMEQVNTLVKAGAIGIPMYGRGIYGIGGRPGYEKEWRANPAMTPGGHLMEQGIHLVDLFRWYLGDFSKAACMLQSAFWNIAPLEENAFALFQGSSGVMAYVHASLTQWKNHFSLEIYGTEGYVGVEGLGGGYGTEKLTLGKRDLTGPFSYQTTEFRGGDISWQREWDDFVAAVNEGRPCLGTGLDGLEALMLVFAAYKSAREERFITPQSLMPE